MKYAHIYIIRYNQLMYNKVYIYNQLMYNKVQSTNIIIIRYIQSTNIITYPLREPIVCNHEPRAKAHMYMHVGQIHVFIF